MYSTAKATDLEKLAACRTSAQGQGPTLGTPSSSTGGLPPEAAGDKSPGDKSPGCEAAQRGRWRARTAENAAVTQIRHKTPQVDAGYSLDIFSLVLKRTASLVGSSTGTMKFQIGFLVLRLSSPICDVVMKGRAVPQRTKSLDFTANSFSAASIYTYIFTTQKCFGHMKDK